MKLITRGPASKYQFLFFGALLVLVLAIYYKNFEEKSDFPSATKYVQKSLTEPNRRQIKKINELPHESSKETFDPEEIQLKDDNVLLKECTADWEYITQTEVIDLEMQLAGGRAILNENCTIQMKNKISLSQIQDFLIQCHDNLSNLETVQREDTCLKLLPSLKAYLTRIFYADSNITELDTLNLANQLYGGHLNLNNATLDDVNRNITLADALIEKDRNLYAPYKGKLLSLIIKELKFGQKIEVESYQAIYDELIRFQPPQVISQPSLEESEEDFIFGKAEELYNLDEDLIHLPFQRLRALKDSAGLYQTATEYVKAYPNSYIGHLYQALALWAEGEGQEALISIKRALGPNVSDDLAYEILQRFQNESPIERISHMNIE